MTVNEQNQVLEIWHNLFRMYGYVVGENKSSADSLLRMSLERLKQLLPQELFSLCEKPESEV